MQEDGRDITAHELRLRLPRLGSCPPQFGILFHRQHRATKGRLLAADWLDVNDVIFR